MNNKYSQLKSNQSLKFNHKYKLKKSFQIITYKLQSTNIFFKIKPNNPNIFLVCV